MKRSINLCKIESIKGFVKDVTYLDSDVNIYKGSYIVDGKSLLGIMSLDLSQPVEVELISNDIEVISEFNEICDRYQ